MYTLNDTKGSMCIHSIHNIECFFLRTNPAKEAIKKKSNGMFYFNSPECTVFIRMPVKIAFTGGISIPVELTRDLVMVSSRLFAIKSKERSKHVPCFSPPPF